uniref:Protocadherin alpha 1 n=1 Tax=Catagonus wagneri TaxID=51154 RepID=A0A8C3WG02_9CETA
MLFSRRGGQGARRLLLSLLLLIAWEAGSGQIHYSVSEEAKHGTFVGRIAQDLGLELAELVPRLFRMASKGGGDLLEVNLQNGILFVNSRIDREELCGQSAECYIYLEVIVNQPLQVFHVEVEVKDINDNPPVFRVKEQRFFIPESRLLDSHFPIEGAADADIGINAFITYTLSPSDYFALDVQANDELSKSLSLELRKFLDREETPEFRLLLTATDGGKPELEGTVQLLITVLDVNDNAPLFAQAVYRVHLLETTANGTLVTTLNASDADEGVNGEIIFSFVSDVPLNIKKTFKIDSSSGEIRLIGRLDYEETKSYEIQVKAVDKGSPPMSNHCKVLVKVLDVNDNAPELAVTSLSLPVREDSPPSTVIAFISLSDRDSGVNGQMTCTLTPHVPFKLVSTFKNYYSLVLDSTLDRESVANYELVVTARDGGSPSLSATASVSVDVADVNDNAPLFAQPEYTVFVKENNAPGCHIFTVSGASDRDIGANSLLTYSLNANEYFTLDVKRNDKEIKSLGLVLKKVLDREDIPEHHLLITTVDGGKPELTGTTQLKITVLDVNDNAPEFESTVYRVRLFENAPNGTLVVIVNASDLDEGVNKDIAYSFSTDTSADTRSKFHLDPVNGYISVKGNIDFELTELYEIQVEATDKGNPPMADHCTVLVEILDTNDNVPELIIKSLSLPILEDATLGTVIALISVLLVLTLLLYTALRCSAPPSGGACVPGKPRLVCSSAEGSWSCSQQRRQRVCSGEGLPKADLMAFSPSLPPGPISGDREEEVPVEDDLPSFPGIGFVVKMFEFLGTNGLEPNQQLVVRTILAALKKKKNCCRIILSLKSG